MHLRNTFILLSFVLLLSCQSHTSEKEKLTIEVPSPTLTLEQANRLAELPLRCMEKEYPNKLSQTLSSDQDLDSHKALHPAFYGCFDWHSAVHGHWMLVRLLKTFPDLENREEILSKLQSHLSAKNLNMELAYFMRESERSFERPYGWAWLLKLAEELHTWDNPTARELEENLKPLTEYIVFKYIDFLPRLHYPVRVGEHSNTAFGMSFAYDYATTVESNELKALLEDQARRLYLKDKNAPIDWEPSGYDFLSPSLQEADLMRKVLPEMEFAEWLQEFLPQLSDPDYQLKPGFVGDRTDGKLVHLDGVNFSRAWCLYDIAKSNNNYSHLRNIANAHIAYSLPNIADGDYMGDHWLASFAIYALMAQ